MLLFALADVNQSLKDQNKCKRFNHHSFIMDVPYQVGNHTLFLSKSRHSNYLGSDY